MGYVEVLDVGFGFYSEDLSFLNFLVVLRRYGVCVYIYVKVLLEVVGSWFFE